MQKVRGINGSALKVIAMVSMVFDHGAAVLLGLLLIKNGIYDVGNLSPDYMRELLALGSPGYLYIAYQIMRRVVGRIAFCWWRDFRGRKTGKSICCVSFCLP